MGKNPQKTVDLFTFTKEILNGKPHYLSSDMHMDKASFHI